MSGPVQVPLNMKALVEQVRCHQDPERMLAAIHLFEPIYEAYQQQLRDTASLDFDGQPEANGE
jgi:DNA helicase-4